MNKSLPLVLFLFFALSRMSIGQNIYESIGKKTDILTLSEGKYQEIFPNDTLVRIGSVWFNTVTNEIASFIPQNDSTYNADEASRFLSIDPIGRKYPELSPYQFASNTPIQAIDLDGLEMFYAADGSYIGRSGKSTEIRVIADKKIIALAKDNLTHPDYNHKWLKTFSKQAYISNDKQETELLKDWAVTYQPQIENKEFFMSLFKKTLINEKGKPLEVIIPGTTTIGPEKQSDGKATVDEKGSQVVIKGNTKDVNVEKEYGWQRSTSIHTHTREVGFSLERNLFGDGYTGDIASALELNIKVLIVTKGQWVKQFDPSLYLKFHKGEIDIKDNDSAIEKATNNNFIYIGTAAYRALNEPKKK